MEEKPITNVFVRNEHGTVIWRASPKSDSWRMDGGTVIVMDTDDNVVEAFVLKPGYILETD